MRILVSTFTYFPNMDGVAEASGVLVNGLIARGHEVEVVTGFHPDRRIAEGDRPRIHQFQVGGHPNRRIGLSGDVAGYQEFLRRGTWDVSLFECWDMWPTAAALPVFPEMAGKKVLVSHGYSAHQWIPAGPPFFGIGQWLGAVPLLLEAPWTLRKFDRLVVLNGKADLGRFLDVGIARATGYGRMSVIPNGANPAEFTMPEGTFRKAHGLAAEPLFVCVANYSERKNQELALRAFRQASLPGSVLCFIGSEFNDYSARLQELNRSLSAQGGGKVLFLEKQDRASVCAAVKDCTALVLSSRLETQPIVLLEGMACGRPFLSTDTGCVRDLPGGLTVRGEAAMAEGFRRLASDPGLRENLSREASEASARLYTWDRVINQYERLLHELVRSS